MSQKHRKMGWKHSMFMSLVASEKQGPGGSNGRGIGPQLQQPYWIFFKKRAWIKNVNKY